MFSFFVKSAFTAIVFIINSDGRSFKTSLCLISFFDVVYSYVGDSVVLQSLGLLGANSL